jgi:hypothetical protein
MSNRYRKRNPSVSLESKSRNLPMSAIDVITVGSLGNRFNNCRLNRTMRESVVVPISWKILDASTSSEIEGGGGGSFAGGIASIFNSPPFFTPYDRRLDIAPSGVVLFKTRKLSAGRPMIGTNFSFKSDTLVVSLTITSILRWRSISVRRRISEPRLFLLGL